MTSLLELQPGDVLCTRNKRGLPALLIRLAAALRDEPNTVNHVVIAHHVDEAGVFWGIEARPGGVGWVDIATLTNAYTLNNSAQPKTDVQRAAVCKAVEGMLGTPYDWAGIALDGMAAIGAQHLWKDFSAGTPPAHVVCSSLADWAYDHVGLKSPGRIAGRTTTPADWAQFIIEKRWQ